MLPLLPLPSPQPVPLHIIPKRHHTVVLVMLLSGYQAIHLTYLWAPPLYVNSWLGEQRHLSCRMAQEQYDLIYLKHFCIHLPPNFAAATATVTATTWCTLSIFSCPRHHLIATVALVLQWQPHRRREKNQQRRRRPRNDTLEIALG